MALSYDQITAITQKKFIPKMVDNIFRSVVLAERLRKKAQMLDGGEKVVQPLMYAKNSPGGWYSGADSLDTTDGQVFTAAEFEWAQLYENITITRRDELKNSGDSAILKFVAKKVMSAEKTIMDRLGQSVHNDGTEANAIKGLRAFISTSATYGGISQSTYSWWQAASVNSTDTVLSIPVMESAFGAATVGAESPTVGITTQTVFDLFHALLQPQERYVDASVGKAGFVSLQFRGKPVIVDNACTASRLYFINEDYLDLYIHKDENFRMDPFQKPTNQNVKTAKIFAMMVLASSNNRMHSALTAIAA